ncbi:cytochrome c oxidase assembly protein [Arthrobacter sp. KBS0703]|jgi:cytochrome c oxidase assembly factor CtaG|uniref:cytochrome c oxidase assembly protein n=1 Tax=Bacteria TaxID=2 RepID=UPI00098F5055|nr:cytochrome c oxidase assembly protein [Arthrobacter sp. KBS0703]TSE15811.1 cytochrome c oxidase assembly protein [Arthrobacter sp. KBS0703]
MPTWDVVWRSWTLNWPALALLLLAAVLYARGVRAAARRGITWPWWRTVTFYVLGLGSFTVLSCGFTGVYSHDLRWVFTLKVTSYLFVVPLLVAAGRPLTLARTSLGTAGASRLERILDHAVVRCLSNTLVAALLGLGIFSLFLTPLFYTLRTSTLWDVLLTIFVPLLGMLMAVPIIEDASTKAISSLIIVEFIYVFIELLADAVPGILMRLSPGIMDGAGRAAAGRPSWQPGPLRDQQMAGDLLWFIAEIVDLPLIILMFVRFARSDRREARTFDDLTDDELDALNRQHLTGLGQAAARVPDRGAGMIGP